MAITLNTLGTAANIASATSGNYTGITVAAGSNSALILTVSFDQTISGLTATWDSGGTNQAMTIVNSQKENTWSRWIYILALLAPTTGNKTLALSWTTSANARLNCVAFDGVLQTSIAAAFTNAANGNNNTSNPTMAVTTSSGDATIVGLMNSSGASAPTQTQIMTTGTIHGFSSYALSTTTSDSHGWTATGTYGLAGIRVNQTSTGITTEYVAPAWAQNTGAMIGRRYV